MVLELAETLRIPVEDYKKMLLSAIISEKLAERLRINTDLAFLGGLFFPSDLVFKIPPEKLAVELKLAHEIIEGYIEDNPTLFCIFYLSKVLAFNLKKDEKFEECLKHLGIDKEILNKIFDRAKEEADKLLI